MDHLVQLCAQYIGRRNFEQVLSDPDAALLKLQQFDVLGALASAEDEAERRFLAGGLLVFGKPAQVQPAFPSFPDGRFLTA